MEKKISIIGLGKLGACMAAAYASKGYQVIGVDLNSAFVDAINQGKAPVKETDLQKYISESRQNLRATINYSEAISNSNITFIIVPTPSEPSGEFSVKFAQSAAKAIGENLKEKSSYHLVGLTSTVLPGDCREKIIPILEEVSGKKCGKDFGFCYSPEFIALGSVIRDLLNPDIFLVGEFDRHSGDVLEEFYVSARENQAPVKRMSIESAELAKISLNHYLTMKITYANMLAEVAENIPGINIDDVIGAIGGDRRIGHHYLKPGLGFGGPCFPRDNRAFARMAQQCGVKAPFAEHTDNYNSSIASRVIMKIRKYAEPTHKIGVVGLSYKPRTPHAEESQAIEITRQLAGLGHEVLVHELEGFEHAKTLLGDGVVYCDELGDCLVKCDIIFLSNLGNDLAEFQKHLRNAGPKIIIDPWRQFKASDFPGSVRYIPLGTNLE